MVAPLNVRDQLGSPDVLQDLLSMLQARRRGIARDIRKTNRINDPFTRKVHRELYRLERQSIDEHIETLTGLLREAA